MMDWIILGGLAYLLIKDRDKVKPKQEEEEVLPEPGGIPTPWDDDTGGRSDEPTRPDPSETVWTETSSWSGEAVTTGPGGTNVVWFFKSGVRYQDGTVDWSPNTYIVIGDENHHFFLTQNSDRGSIDIKWEFTGNPDKRDSKNVTVFASLEEAIEKADEMSNPPEDDDPLGPQKQPEPEEDKPTQPSLPSQPGLGLGGNQQWTGAYMGGGL